MYLRMNFVIILDNDGSVGLSSLLMVSIRNFVLKSAAEIAVIPLSI